MPTLDNHALSAVAVLLLLTGCEKHHWSRECVTTKGEVFTYQQSSRDSLAEDHKHIVNRHGVRDTNGWWRDEETIASCRDKN